VYLARLLSGLYVVSRVTPVARFNGALELFVDERLQQPLLKVGGRTGRKAYAILSKRFLTRTRNGVKEILIPLTAFPAVSVWLLASYRSKPSEHWLDELLYRTPKVLADFVWDLVEMPTSNLGEENHKPLIDYRLATRASKIVREMLKLYKLV